MSILFFRKDKEKNTTPDTEPLGSEEIIKKGDIEEQESQEVTEEQEIPEEQKPQEAIEEQEIPEEQKPQEAIEEQEIPEEQKPQEAIEEQEIPEEQKPQEIPEEQSEKRSFFSRLKDGLKKTKDSFVKNIDELFNGSYDLSEEFYEELEEILIMGDVGVEATQRILETLEEQINEKRIRDTSESLVLLKTIINDMLTEQIKEEYTITSPTVILMVGVNGVGKTTSVGKLAGKFKAEGKKVVIAAADTFRAAAVDQLREWAKRADVDMVGGAEGNDPASVVFDAISSAKAKNADILLVDTAGRLHNKKNLMNELAKINRVIDREFPQAKREVFCVLDATTGQNALIQAQEFNESSPLSGLVLTKMDGTAKGGIVVAICTKLNIPVRFIGVGEKTQDLEVFDPQEFVEALFSKDE